jgi:hypothetical protein
MSKLKVLVSSFLCALVLYLYRVAFFLKAPVPETLQISNYLWLVGEDLKSVVLTTSAGYCSSLDVELVQPIIMKLFIKLNFNHLIKIFSREQAIV